MPQLFTYEQIGIEYIPIANHHRQDLGDLNLKPRAMAHDATVACRRELGKVAEMA